MQFDFRSVYGSILVDWFGVAAQSVRDLLFTDFQHLPILNSCSNTTALAFLDKQQIGLAAFPNPFTQQTKIEFTLKAGWARISLFDVLGHEIKVLSHQRFNEGTHAVTLEGQGLPTGSYYCHVRTAYGQEVKRIIKVG
ncbi:MAG: T9SS type A sorting domain-containing protein [Saprospiraceae bacterium]